VKGICKSASCYLTPCTDGKLCIGGECIEDPCAKKSCANDEVCRPVDGKCIKKCHTCDTGKKCVNGACVDDPCDGVTCGGDERCDNGSCVKDPCKEGGQVCKFRRYCDNGTCTEDPCLSVKCPQKYSCKQGVCYGSPVAPEPIDEPKMELFEEAIIETTTDIAQTEKVADTGLIDAGQQGELKISFENLPTAGGGCTCSTSNTSQNAPFVILFVFVLGLFLRRRKR